LTWRLGISCAWGCVSSVLSALVIAVAIVLVLWPTAHDAVDQGLVFMGTMIYSAIGAVAGGLIGSIISFCVITSRRRRAAERGGG
jgi:hypothetical protein